MLIKNNGDNKIINFQKKQKYKLKLWDKFIKIIIN